MSSKNFWLQEAEKQEENRLKVLEIVKDALVTYKLTRGDNLTSGDVARAKKIAAKDVKVARKLERAGIDSGVEWKEVPKEMVSDKQSFSVQVKTRNESAGHKLMEGIKANFASKQQGLRAERKTRSCCSRRKKIQKKLRGEFQEADDKHTGRIYGAELFQKMRALSEKCDEVQHKIRPMHCSKCGKTQDTGKELFWGTNNMFEYLCGDCHGKQSDS